MEIEKATTSTALRDRYLTGKLDYVRVVHDSKTEITTSEAALQLDLTDTLRRHFGRPDFCFQTLTYKACGWFLRFQAEVILAIASPGFGTTFEVSAAAVDYTENGQVPAWWPDFAVCFETLMKTQE